MVKWLRTPAKQPTTSEPTAGNSRPGAPVKAPMSGRLVCNQGGTVEYSTVYCIPPLNIQGWDCLFFDRL